MGVSPVAGIWRERIFAMPMATSWMLQWVPSWLTRCLAAVPFSTPVPTTTPWPLDLGDDDDDNDDDDDDSDDDVTGSDDNDDHGDAWEYRHWGLIQGLLDKACWTSREKLGNGSFECTALRAGHYSVGRSAGISGSFGVSTAARGGWASTVSSWFACNSHPSVGACITWGQHL